ncbi:transcriptional repressor TCF25-domain-containing protein [Schizophyllum commune]
MPPRLSKRQQRELEELEALEGLTKHQPASEDEADEEAPSPQAAQKSGFAALLSQDDVAEEDSEVEEAAVPTKARKNKKKKKKSTAVAASPVLHTPQTPQESARDTPTPSASAKKAAKKAKQKEKKSGKDDVERALAELSLQYPSLSDAASALSSSTSASRTSMDALARLLAVSPAHLDPDAEMRKFFGAKVVQANREKGAASPRRAGGTEKSNLTRPQPGWWPAKMREGLTTRQLTQEELDAQRQRHGWAPLGEERWWTVEYSKKYKAVTKAFMRVVMAGDPEGFYNLLHRLCWHADTLLQLSELYRHREEHATAVDFADRALFTYERAMLGAFNLTSGVNRLDFDHVETRPFFLAVHRQVGDLQRRGCFRTSFEFARLLYALDPWNDPHGALLHLDFLPFKAHQTEWLLSVWDIFTSWKKQEPEKLAKRMDPTLLPGWNYSRALALYIKEKGEKSKKHDESTAALVDAVKAFPPIVPLLADKLEVSLPESLRSHCIFRIETDASHLSGPDAIMHLLCHQYVQRAFSVWQDDSYTAWFKETISSNFASLPPSLPVAGRRAALAALLSDNTLQHSIYRHVLVLENRPLFAFIPRAVLSARSLACDPLPPPTALTAYDDAFFRGVEDAFVRTRREREADARRLARLVPDAGFRQQLQGFFDAHPAIAARFPGGVVQFAQMAAQAPEDVEDIMMVEAMAGAEGVFGEGGMPGEMPGLGEGEWVQEVEVDEHGHEEEQGEEEEDEEDEDEDEEDEDEDIEPMPVRVIRNLLGRLWGGGAAQQDESSSDEEDDAAQRPVDTAGVD